MQHIVIIGNGISGVTAARHIRKKSDHQITIISSETKYFYSRTALMYVYMGHMKFEHTQPYESWFWDKNRIDLVEGKVLGVDSANKTLNLEGGSDLKFDKLIIATGSKPNKFGWPGQDLEGVAGLYHKKDLETIEKYAPDNKTCKRAVIVGGGLIGIEMAEMLRSRNIPVTFLVRESSFWSGVLPAQESQMINEHILEHHIDLRLGFNLKEIFSDDNGKVKAIEIVETGEVIECDFVGLTAGVSPNIDFIKESGIEVGRGVLVNRFLETNIKDIFAIGDCAEQHEAIGQRRNIEAVWYTGRMMGESVAATICGSPTEYKPGHWFNSAKFLDIEYQTYGWVWAKQKEGEIDFYWENKTKKLAMHFNFREDNHQFIGVNTFGIRLRHEFFDKILSNKETIEHVLEHLADANFDPEFFKTYESGIIDQFNHEYKTDLKPKKKSWKRIFLNQ